MTTTDERPTIAERYSGAIESSNLKLSHRRGDVDLVIAAALGGAVAADASPAEREKAKAAILGSALYRLQVCYDAVRADHRAAELLMRRQEEGARHQTDDKPAPPNLGATPATLTAKQKMAAALKVAEGAALTAHVLILSQLPGLDTTKELFGAFAVIQATKRRLMRNDREVGQIAGRVLDVFLRPQCGHCDGRGFNGATHRGEKQILCRPCRGSGHRRDAVGKDDAERGFAGHLLMAIDQMLHQAQKDMSSNVHAVADAKHWIAEQSGVAL